MVSDMRGTKLKDELIRIEQVLKAAEVEFTIKDETVLEKTPPLVENVLSMCLKEAVTNIVKHSKATTCLVELRESGDELSIRVKDNGTGIEGKIDPTKKTASTEWRRGWSL
nr:ATP-binding protein [Sinobaca sp. H24]